MTEQERPRTEAGKAFVAIATSQGTGLGHLPEPLPVIVARIEAEGRQEAGLPSVEELAEAIMRHDADDSWPSGSLVAHDRGRCGNNRCAATILHEVRRLRAAPPLHDPSGDER